MAPFNANCIASWAGGSVGMEGDNILGGCTVVSSIERFHCIQDSQVGPSGVHYREVPLYTGQPAES